jgi:hypothetical protein
VSRQPELASRPVRRAGAREGALAFAERRAPQWKGE